MLTFKQHIWESSIGRLAKHLGGHGDESKRSTVAILSAQRGHLSTEENNRRHAELTAHVRDIQKTHPGIGHVHVQGGYIENQGTPSERHVHEKSIMLIGHHPKDAAAIEHHATHLGTHFDQDSVLVAHHDKPHAELIGTTHRDDAWLKHGERSEVGKFHPRKIGEFYTRHKNEKLAFSESINEGTQTVHLNGVVGYGAFMAPKTFYQRGDDVLF